MRATLVVPYLFSRQPGARRVKRQEAGHEKRERRRPTEPKAATIEMKQENGAGEEIRTLDPNLGKVVLYP
jgi:hypothetical protein